MEFNLSEEQNLLIDTTKAFVKEELLQHEALLEKTNNLPKELYDEIKQKSIKAGLYACNMPTEYGGGGLNAFDLTLVEKHLGFASLALAEISWRPQNILMACEGGLIDEYLKPTITGERKDCIAMTEPGAGSDLRGMKTKAVKDGNDWVINGTKQKDSVKFNWKLYDGSGKLMDDNDYTFSPGKSMSKLNDKKIPK